MKQFIIAGLIVLSLVSCKDKGNDPPSLTFKTDSGYVSSDITVPPGTTFTVGVICKAGSDPLHLLYSEIAYDGANVDSLYERQWIPETTPSDFEHDFIITTRNETGTERWKFTINDKDGRLTEKYIRVSVQ